MVREVMASPAAPAGNTLYVDLSKDHRVSRSFRATWYMRHLGKPVSAITSPSQQQVRV